VEEEKKKGKKGGRKSKRKKVIGKRQNFSLAGWPKLI
jgi:hypothetical protein